MNAIININKQWRWKMAALKRILVFKITIVVIMLGICVAAGIPRYINLNKHNEASQCRRNQVVVETALAIAYAESLAVGSTSFPSELSTSMFDDGIIPTCPRPISC